MLEYLLLMALVAFLVLSSFKPNGILDLTRQATNAYFSSGSRAIMGGYYNTTGGTNRPTFENPAPVNGGWCGWSLCMNDVQTRECACPRAAFGGKECAGEALLKGCGGPQTAICDAALGFVYDPSSPWTCACAAGLKINPAKTACVKCTSDGSCSAAVPGCGETTYGVDNCGITCHRTGGGCPIVCTPDCSCAANTCVGSTCPDRCKGTCPGKKPLDNSCAANTCPTSTCTDGCQVYSGTKPLNNSCAANTCPTSTCTDGCQVYPGTKAPDNSCAANTCPTTTCTDSCGNVFTGTKTTGSCAAVCPDGICNGSENCVTCWQDCQCPVGRNPTNPGYCKATAVPPVCVCTPDCFFRVCGDDGCGGPGCGCGGHCTGGCNVNSICDATGWCVCDPKCGTKMCGADNCGGGCGPLSGACPVGKTCVGGVCQCIPNCSGKPCGSNDGCGGSCKTGTCGYLQHCSAGSCVADTCVNWTFDHCGGSCGGYPGSCTAIQHCAAGQCSNGSTNYTGYDCAWDPGCVCQNAGGSYPGDGQCHWATMSEPCSWSGCNLTPCKTMSCTPSGSGPASPCGCPSTGTTECVWMVVQCTSGSGWSSGTCSVVGYDACAHLLY
jgi:hypothetical protein